MGSHKIDLTFKWRIYAKCHIETDAGSPIWHGPGCYSCVSLEVCWNQCTNIQNLCVWWACIFQKNLFHQKISNRTVDKRVAEKENEVSSSTKYRSISHMFYHCAVTSQFKLFCLLNNRLFRNCQWIDLVVTTATEWEVDCDLQL